MAGGWNGKNPNPFEKILGYNCMCKCIQDKDCVGLVFNILVFSYSSPIRTVLSGWYSLYNSAQPS